MKEWHPIVNCIVDDMGILLVVIEWIIGIRIPISQCDND